MSNNLFPRSEQDVPRRPSQQKPFWVVAVLPERAEDDPLILLTSLPIRTVQEARRLAELYGGRWGIETAFETCKRELGLGRFMVRRVEAVERLLDLVALAYALLVVLLVGVGRAREHLRQAIWEVLQRWSVWRPRGRLTVGKLREVLMLDGRENRCAWRALLERPPEFS